MERKELKTMKTKKILSRIALLLAIIMSLSVFAACDLGLGDDEEEEKNSSKIKLYVYDSEQLPDSVENIDDDAWKTASKKALCADTVFEPGATKLHLAKVENTGKKDATVTLFFKTKGEINPIASSITFAFNVTDESGENEIVNPQSHNLSNLLDGTNFITFTIGAKETYYVSLAFFSEDFGDYDDYTLGGKLYLSYGAVTMSDSQDLPPAVATTSPDFSISDTHNESYTYEESYSYPETYPGTNPGYTEDTSEATENNGVLESTINLHKDGVISTWHSYTHTNNTRDSLTLYIYSSGYLSFNVDISSEGGCDKLTVYHNDSYYADYSGEHNGIYECFYVNSGDVVQMYYSKDGSVSEGEDMAYVYNISIVDKPHNPLDSESESESGTSIYEQLVPSTPEGDVDGMIYGESADFDFAMLYNETVGEYEGVWYSLNQNDGASSYLRVNFTKSGYITFSAFASSESGCDFVTVHHNYSDLYEFTGSTEWSEEIYIDVRAGDFITFYYTKDGSQSVGDDRGYIRNLTFHLYPASEEQTVGSAPIETAPIEDCFNVYGDSYTETVVTGQYGQTYTVFYTNNHEAGSVSNMYMEALQTGILYFDMLCSTEYFDYIRVYVDEEEIICRSGNDRSFYTHKVYVGAGQVVRFEYSKNGDTDSYDDTVYFRNFAFSPR